jgi:hypothetical protein
MNGTRGVCRNIVAVASEPILSQFTDTRKVTMSYSLPLGMVTLGKRLGELLYAPSVYPFRPDLLIGTKAGRYGSCEDAAGVRLHE